VLGWFRAVGGTIRSPLGTISSLYLFVVAAYALREIAIARTFGVSDAVDAFLLAYALPLFAISVFANSFNSAVIPTFIRIRQLESDAAGHAFLSNLLGLALLVLTAVMIVLAAVYPVILPRIASGFGEEKLALTRSLFLLLAPVIVLTGMNVVLTAVLNGLERFALGAIVPATTPLVTAAALLIWPSASIRVAAIGLVAGAVCELTILVVALRRGGLAIRARWPAFDRHIRVVGSQYLSVVVGGLMMSATPLVDQAMAAMLGAGAPSALSYGSKVVTFGIGLTTIAIGTAVMPYFSRMVAESDWEALRASLRGYLITIAAVTVPISIAFVIFSEPLVRLIFQYGRFDAADTAQVARVQQAFALQIPFYAAMVPLVRAISALRANHILAMLSAVNLVACVTLNYVFMKRLGVAGIALSTSCVYAISFGLNFIMLRRLLRKASSPLARSGRSD
jgi:putative peptidoglycan lipid II flippase